MSKKVKNLPQFFPFNRRILSEHVSENKRIKTLQHRSLKNSGLYFYSMAYPFLKLCLVSGSHQSVAAHCTNLKRSKLHRMSAWEASSLSIRIFYTKQAENHCPRTVLRFKTTPESGFLFYCFVFVISKMEGGRRWSWTALLRPETPTYCFQLLVSSVAQHQTPGILRPPPLWAVEGGSAYCCMISENWKFISVLK